MTRKTELDSHVPGQAYLRQNPNSRREKRSHLYEV